LLSNISFGVCFILKCLAKQLDADLILKDRYPVKDLFDRSAKSSSFKDKKASRRPFRKASPYRKRDAKKPRRFTSDYK